MKRLARLLFRLLARLALRRHRPLVIAVAGSVGKTATKEAVAVALMSPSRSVRKTEGSFNAEIGVPATILSGGPAPETFGGWWRVVLTGLRTALISGTYPDLLVLELGVDHPGDLQPLLNLVRPKIGILTSTAPEHLEYFGREENVVAEESLVVRSLPRDGTPIINIDDQSAGRLKSRLPTGVITYGWDSGATIRADSMSFTSSDLGQLTGMVVKVAIDGSVIPVAMPGVIGRHQAYPLLAALAAARALGDDLLTAAQHLQAYQPPPGRMRLLEGLHGSLLIDDSYNASPLAVQAAMATLTELELPGKTYAVLGQMSELGAASARWHDAIGQMIGRRRLDWLITIGPLAKRIGTAAVVAGLPADRVENVDTPEAAAASLRSRLGPGDAVLLKGSRYPKPGYSGYITRAVDLLLAHPERDRHLLASFR